MLIQEMESFPENSNPYHHDHYRMGKSIDRRWEVMFDSHEDNEWIIVVNKMTGERFLLSEQPLTAIRTLGDLRMKEEV